MKNVIFSLWTILLLGISCKKSTTPDPQPPGPPVKYMSLTTGSTWNYERINNITVITTPFTLTASSKDSSINGKAYRVLTNSSGTGNEYSNITGNEYYNFRSLPEALGSSSIEYLYLKDNVAVGGSWSQTYPVTVSGFPLSATLTNTVTEKGISKTVKGITYDNVIHITTTVAVSVSGIPLPASALTADIQSYYATKIGLIQSINKIHLDYLGFTNTTDEQINLNSSDIK